jgi:hypothetical protein
MSFLVYILWVAFNTILLNIAVKTGWNFDPGYLGPSIIILTFNMIIALYTRQRSES